MDCTLKFRTDLKQHYMELYNFQMTFYNIALNHATFRMSIKRDRKLSSRLATDNFKAYHWNNSSLAIQHTTTRNSTCSPIKKHGILGLLIYPFAFANFCWFDIIFWHAILFRKKLKVGLNINYKWNYQELIA